MQVEIFMFKDHIYTGTADGKILHIYKGEIQTLAKLGKDPCGKDCLLYTFWSLKVQCIQENNSICMYSVHAYMMVTLKMYVYRVYLCSIDMCVHYVIYPNCETWIVP